MGIPDNYDLWEAQDVERERRRARRPVCSRCGEHIQEEEAYLIEGAFICQKCMEQDFKVWVDDFTEK
jgi:formylmethanofuran dehydrogenase subunit E